MRNSFLTGTKFDGWHIKLLKGGHNRQIYSLTSKDGAKAIAKLGKRRKDHGSSQETEASMLAYFAEKNINFIPRLLLWNSTQDLLVETCAGTATQPHNTFTHLQIETFARQLATIHSLDAQEFAAFCETNNFTTPHIITSQDELRIYGKERFALFCDTHIDRPLMRWIENILQRCDVLVKDSDMSNPARILWGDIGDNTRTDGDKIYFIDWEYARLGYSNELAYIKIHSHFNPDQFSAIATAYARHANTPLSEILQKISQQEFVIRACDVIWAAMKWHDATTPAEQERYRVLAYKRKQLVTHVAHPIALP